MAIIDASTGSGGAILRCDLELVSQSQAGNSSVVSGTLQILNVPSAAYVNSAIGCGVYINGAWYYASFTWASGGGSRSIQTINVTVPHDPAGNASPAFAGEIQATGTQGIGGATQTPTGSVALPRIPIVASAPTSPTASPGVGQATVGWVTPSDNGGGGITGYRVYYSTNSNMSGGSSTDVGVVTSTVVSGLTPGATYYFTIAAINVAGVGAQSSVASALIGAVPGAPTSPAAVAVPGALGITWATPTTDGGVAISGYRVDYDTSSSFTAPASATVNSTTRSLTITGLPSGTVYYARVFAINSVGTGTASATASTTTPARSTLDYVQGATVSVSGGAQVELRTDGADVPTITLGYTAFGTGTTFVAIATLPTGPGAAQFATPGGSRNLDLVADAAGNLFVIGRQGSNPSAVLVLEYVRTATNTWAVSNSLAQALANTGDGLVAFAAVYVPGSGGAPIASILVVARRAGTVGAGSLSYATLNLASLAAGSGALFINSGSDPAWLTTPPTASAINSGTVDVATLVANGTRVAILANSYAIVDVINGVVSLIVQAPAGGTTLGPWARIFGVSSTAFAVLNGASGALVWTFYDAGSGAVLGTGNYPAANFQGGAAGSQWDAYYNRASAVLTAYYITATAGAQSLSSINISPISYAATAAVALTTALGAASSTNSLVRVAGGPVDERRVIVAAGNLLAGAKSTSAYPDTLGNLAPNAPALVHEPGYDASNARTFSWAFSDPNPSDAQVAYDLQIQRVSDSVNVVGLALVASSSSSSLVAANTLANGIAYRWRVRTTDALGAYGAWSSYDSFSTAALGTLTITSPAADNPAGLINSSIPITWSYAQVNAYVQTQSRIRVLNTVTSAVISDTTMVASTATSANVTVPTDVQVTIELSIVTNAPGTPTVLTTRILTSSFGTPPAPTVALAVGASFIVITATNPTNVGSKPNATSNYIDRAPTGTTAWVTIAKILPGGTYRDHGVASGVAYDYRVRARA